VLGIKALGMKALGLCRRVAKGICVAGLVGLLGLTSGWGIQPALAAPKLAFPTRSRSPEPKLTGRVSEMAPPPLIQELQAEFDDNQPQVTILEPKPNAVLADNRVSVQFQVKDLTLFKNAKFGLGPHLHVLLDNQTYQPVYDADQPLVLENLTPGTHTLRAIAARPWHESFKNDGAYAQVTFHVFTQTDENNPDPELPLLTYSRPQGTYGAEPIMLDFYLTNAPLHLVAQEDKQDDIADWRIRATVNGDSFILDQWQPVYLKGFKPGKNWVKLEYIDEQGNPVNNLYSNTARLITLDPDGQDGLAQLVRGDVSLEEIRGIVDPNYVYTPPAPAPEPTLEPAPEPVPSAAVPSKPTQAPIIPPVPSVVRDKTAPAAVDDMEAGEKLEAREKLKAEEKLREEKLREEKLRAEKLQQAKLRQEKLRQERLQEEKRQEEKLQQEKRQEEKLQEEKLQQEKLQEEKLQAEKLQQEKLQEEKLQQEKLQAEKLRQEKLQEEKLQAEKLRREKLQAEKLQAEKLQQEKLQAEKLQQEKLQAEKIQQEKLQQEKLQQEKLQQEKLQAEKLRQESLQAEKLQAEKLRQKKLQQEQLRQDSQASEGPPALAPTQPISPEKPSIPTAQQAPRPKPSSPSLLRPRVKPSPAPSPVPSPAAGVQPGQESSAQGGSPEPTAAPRLQKPDFLNRFKLPSRDSVPGLPQQPEPADAPTMPSAAVKAPPAKASPTKAPPAKTPPATADDEAGVEPAPASSFRNRFQAPPLRPKGPEVKAPDRATPDRKAPDAKLPDVTLPDVKLPDMKLPDVKTPDFGGFLKQLQQKATRLQTDLQTQVEGLTDQASQLKVPSLQDFQSQRSLDRPPSEATAMPAVPENL
jgi:uncharacterized protein YjbI with pentapeptide repeats